MNKKKNPLFIALIVVLAAPACRIALPLPALVPADASVSVTTQKAQPTMAKPTESPSAIQVVPTNSPTITMTPFPSITPLPPPSATATVTPYGFVASKTPGPTTDAAGGRASGNDPAEGATDPWGSNYRCTLISKSVSDWTVVPPLQKYKVSWTLLNSGLKRWQTETVALVFVGGDKMYDDKTVPLLRDVKVNETMSPVVNIYPPKPPGDYISVYGLQVIRTEHVFCTFTVKVTVKK